MGQIKIGYAPTRRSIFSAPDAVRYRGLTAERLKELDIDFVDITDINEEGLLYNDEDMLKQRKNSNVKRSMDCSCRTVILARSMNADGWQRNCRCRFSLGASG